MPTPEEIARQNIDKQLEACGWLIQSRRDFNLYAARGVLEYFDGFLIGLTATPSNQTFGFFNQNLVMEDSRLRAVADGVNVHGEVSAFAPRSPKAAARWLPGTGSASASAARASNAGSSV